MRGQVKKETFLSNDIKLVKIHRYYSSKQTRNFNQVTNIEKYTNSCRDSSFGIATRYGLEGPGVESLWGARFSATRPDRPCGPSSLLYNGYRVSFQGEKRTGRGVDHRLPTGAQVEERLELYLYSPSGTSWLVLG
jgi:hypothetical protein